jgi:hypothetical protein
MDSVQAASDLADAISGAAIRGKPLSYDRIQTVFATHEHRVAAAIERARAAAPAG